MKKDFIFSKWFSLFIQKLQFFIFKLFTKHDLISLNINLFQHIQRTLLPISEDPSFHYVVHYNALHKLSGDYYDVFKMNNDTFSFIIADISGHGPETGLLGIVTKLCFYEVVPISNSTSETLTLVNKKLTNLIITSDYLTAFYIIFCKQTYTLSYSNAGHPYMLLWHHSSNTVSILYTDGFFLAALEPLPYPYTQQVIKVEPKDRLILYTDGLIEQTNKKGVKYGLSSLQNLVCKLSHLSILELKEHIIMDWEVFRSKASKKDDTTLIIIEIT